MNHIHFSAYVFMNEPKGYYVCDSDFLYINKRRKERERVLYHCVTPRHNEQRSFLSLAGSEAKTADYYRRLSQ